MSDANTNASDGGELSCRTIADNCDILEDVMYPEYQDSVYADDTTWILTAAFIIFTMQSGFAMLEIGVSTPGNEVNVMLKNVCDILFATVAFYLVGYGIAYGTPSNGFMGMGDFVPTTDFNDPIGTALFYGQYIFNLSFAATNATIMGGATAMRMRFSVYCMVSFFSVIVYAFVAHWVWADSGWLGQLGVHDFAGGGPVHLLGGFNSFIAIKFLGSRHGRFDGTRPESDYAESSPTNQLLGTMILWFAWIGFNCGSSFGITEEKWLVACRTAVNTMNSSSGGGIMGLIYSQWATKRKFVRAYDLVNGVLGGLIASSPTSACVQPHEAFIIGAIGALAACWSNEKLLKNWMKIDDPVGAIGAHAIAASWGIFAVGLFADSRFTGIDVRDGLFHGGGFAQLGSQVLEIVAIIGWSIATFTPFFYIVGVVGSRDLRNPRPGLRLEVPGEHEYPHRADPYIHDCFEETVDVGGIMDTVKEQYYDELCNDVLQRLKERSKRRVSAALDKLENELYDSLQKEEGDEQEKEEKTDEEKKEKEEGGELADEEKARDDSPPARPTKRRSMPKATSTRRIE